MKHKAKQIYRIVVFVTVMGVAILRILYRQWKERRMNKKVDLDTFVGKTCDCCGEEFKKLLITIHDDGDFFTVCSLDCFLILYSQRQQEKENVVS